MADRNNDTALDAEILAALAAELRPREPAPERRAALRQRIAAELDLASPDDPGRTDSNALPQELSGAIMAHLIPIEPSAEVRNRVRQRLHREIQAQESPAISTLTVHEQQGAWYDIAEGVSIKPLYGDKTSGARSFLMRLAPGTTYPAHQHSYHEECIVLEGDARIGEVEVGRGDYHLAPSGSRHEALSTTNGALLFLRAGYEDTELSAGGKLQTLARTVWNRLRGS